MNNKFKRVISSILAFTMVISVLTVMNVTTAFAATTVYTIATTSLVKISNGGYYDMSDDTSTGATSTTDRPSSTNRNLFWIRGGSGDVAGSLSDTSITVDGTTYTCSNYVGNDGNNAVGALALYVDKGYKITAYFNTPSSNGASAVSIATSMDSEDTNKIDTSSILVTYPETGTTSGGSTGLTISYTTTSAGVYYIGATTKRAQFYAVTLEPTVETDDYTLSGGVSGEYTGDTFTITDKNGDEYEAAIDSEAGTYSFTASVTSGSSEPYEEGDTFTVTAPSGYTVSPETVSITNYASDTKTYTLDDITFTAKAAVTISGTVSNTDSIALPTSAVVALTNSDGTIATSEITDGAFSFTAEEGLGDATVSITGAEGYYTTTSKDITIASANITDIALTSTLITGGKVVTNETYTPDAKYTFTDYSGTLLVDPSGSNSTASTPYYYSDNDGYCDKLTATLDSTNGLTLLDNSSTDTVYVRVPLPTTISSGTVTVEANIKMSKQSGSWSIMTLGGDSQFAALRSNSAKVLVGMLGTDSTTANSYTTADGEYTAYTANTFYKVTMVVDYDNNKVTTYVDDDQINEATSESDLSNFSYIMFRTAKDDDARVLYVKDLSVTVDTTNVITVDGTTYLIAGVADTDADLTQYDYAYLAVDEDGTAYDKEGTSGATTVYTAVEIDGTEYSAEKFGYKYVFGFALDSTITADAVTDYYLALGSSTEG